jgi:hypothetical protein
MQTSSKNAIALLITLFFLMAITVSLGLGLKYLNTAKADISKENFLLQTNVILDDVLTFLEKSPELELIKNDKSGEAYDIFLAQSEFIPFEAAGVKLAISIKSARTKINLNQLLNAKADDNTTQYKLLEHFKTFLGAYNVNPIYVELLKDSVSKYDINYYPATDILDAKPDIYREYIASYEHLDEISEHYKNTYYENSLEQLELKDLFYVASPSKNYCIDSFYISNWAKHLLEGVEIEAAEDFIVDTNTSRFSDLYCKDEKERRVVEVELEVMQGSNTADIKFEYNIEKSKGYNFSYEI